LSRFASVGSSAVLPALRRISRVLPDGKSRFLLVGSKAVLQSLRSKYGSPSFSLKD
jgi:hypothetical protein